MGIRPIGHEDRLSLVEHLDELRSRLVVCTLVFLAAFSFCYWQNDALLEIVNDPLETTQNLECQRVSEDPLEQASCFSLRSAEAARALSPALNGLGESLRALSSADGVSAQTRADVARNVEALKRAARAFELAERAAPRNRERQPVTLGVAEPFVTTFTVAAYGALLLCLPFLLWQAYAFVLPAFTPHERRTALPLMLMVPVLFIGGVAFAYFVALPRAVDFLQNFNDDAFDILIGARDYYRFSIVFMAVVGLLFQIPVGVLAVTRLGIVTTKQLRRNRGYVLLGMAVLSAIATPTPDPVTMLLAMAPLVLLFELSVQLARIFEPRWNEASDDDLD